MKFVFTEKKVQLTDDQKSYAEKKIGKLDRFFKSESEAFITFSSERARNIVEVTVRNNGTLFRVSENATDMFSSIDNAVSAIEQQIRKNKTRLERKLREGVVERDLKAPAGESEEEEQFHIIRTKRFAIKPMSPEEAILQMNLLGHTFFVFRNQENDAAFTVVYRRMDGGYGLIESDGN